MNFERLKIEFRGTGYALLLVALMTAIMMALVGTAGMTHGPMIYIIPVMIAATRWGLAPAIVAAIAGIACSAFFLYRPIYSFFVRDPQNILNLSLFILVAVITSQLASRLKTQAEISRQREIDMRDLYAFSRRLAAAFDVPEIHSAIEDHIASVTERKVVLFASARDAVSGSGRRSGITVPDEVRQKVTEVAEGSKDHTGSFTVPTDQKSVWLVRAVSPRSLEFGVIAIHLGQVNKEAADELRVRVDTALADATATLERLGVASAINEARMRAQTDQLREALIGSVSHELRTPLASIMGAATVLGAAPALADEKKLKALVTDVHDEALRLNHDIQNLLDASRISSDGIDPIKEWADPADIVNAAVERCRRRLDGYRLTYDIPSDVPLIHVDPVLVQQALVQIIDNARKYSPSGSVITISVRARGDVLAFSVSDQGAGLTEAEKLKMWDRFFRGERQIATTSGSGLGLWIAHAFISSNNGRLIAQSEGPGKGTSIIIELPVTEAAVTANMDTDSDE